MLYFTPSITKHEERYLISLLARPKYKFEGVREICLYKEHPGLYDSIPEHELGNSFVIDVISHKYQHNPRAIPMQYLQPDHTFTTKTLSISIHEDSYPGSTLMIETMFRTYYVESDYRIYVCHMHFLIIEDFVIVICVDYEEYKITIIDIVRDRKHDIYISLSNALWIVEHATYIVPTRNHIKIVSAGGHILL